MSLLPPEDPAVRFQIWLRKSRRPYQKPGEQQKPQLHKGLHRERRSTYLKRRLLHLFSLFVLIPHNWGANCIFSNARNWTKIENIQSFPHATLVFLALSCDKYMIQCAFWQMRYNKDLMQMNTYRHCIYANLLYYLKVMDLTWLVNSLWRPNPHFHMYQNVLPHAQIL